jgi:hypothetical protein
LVDFEAGVESILHRRTAPTTVVQMEAPDAVAIIVQAACIDSSVSSAR